jgi:SNF family Na+-dependent transporter
MAKKVRQRWGTKLGLILAVAGSAVGLGNFLRFPSQVVMNGGGAFMIPYFISLILLGIPMMWIEWSLGRYGGIFGHGTAPGIFHSLWRNRFIKYFGIIGIFGPVVIFIYYTYIESWLLGYAAFSLWPKFMHAAKLGETAQFLQGYQGVVKNQYFQGLHWAYFFFLVTFFLNFLVIGKGIAKGIERFSKFAMPVLLIVAAFIAVRVVTLGALNPARPEWNIFNGYGFLWNPIFSALKDPKVWLAAAGQIFFTLSGGIGVIMTYASYLKKEDDVVASGLTSVSINEFCEVILGASIVIPAAYMFFGPLELKNIVAGGMFNISFVTMPKIFAGISFGQIFSFLWYALLFFAGVTSSVSLLQPAIAFLEEEFDLSRAKAVKILAAVCFVLCQPAIFFLGRGVVDELDFWGGTFGLVLFATIEAILFTWIFGIDKAWKEIHQGAGIRIPAIFKPIMKYVTPSILLVVLATWFWQNALPLLLFKNIPAANIPYILGIRLILVFIVIALALMVRAAWKNKKYAKEVVIK